MFDSLSDKHYKTQYCLYTRAPIGSKINQCHFGPLRFFFMRHPKYTPNFGAGQKHNQCHGTVALARWAPLFIQDLNNLRNILTQCAQNIIHRTELLLCTPCADLSTCSRPFGIILTTLSSIVNNSVKHLMIKSVSEQ